MSTATTTHQHTFPTSLILGAASAVVLVGGLTAYGISASQDSTAPTHSQVSTSTTPHQQCPDVRCMPRSTSPSQRHGYGSQYGSHEPTLKGGQPTLNSGPPALKGGHTTIGLS